MSVRLLVASRSDVGRLRSGNEDAFLVVDEMQLVAVADGMGGHQAGEVASATAIDSLRTGLERGDSIEDAITGANDAVVSQAAADLALRGMGTTMTAGIVHDSVLRIGHVGDSRAYLLRAGELRQVTIDHSVVAELIAAGELTEDEALVDSRRAMITRALGIDTTVEVDVFDVGLEPGDRFLFCSDGLTTMIRDGAIAEILASEDDRERAADELVNAANIAGGADNITVVIVDVVEIGDRRDRRRCTSRQCGDGRGPRGRCGDHRRVGRHRRSPRRRRRDHRGRSGRHRGTGPRRQRGRRPRGAARRGGGRGTTPPALVAAPAALVSSPAASRRRMLELLLGLFALGITTFGYVLVQLADSPDLPPEMWLILAGVIGLFVVAHLAVRRFAPQADPTLLPLAAFLTGFGFMMIARLDEDLARVQAVWAAVGVAAFVATLVVVRRVRTLERYRYTFLMLGVLALVLPLFPGVGEEINGARLWVRFGPLNFQPGEAAKVLLVIFFAAYLVDKRELLKEGTRRVGRMSLPDPKYLGPLLLAWGASLLIMVRQKDLGSSLLFFAVFAAMLYIATERASYLLVGFALFVGGATVAYHMFTHVQERVSTWRDPWPVAQDEGFQLVQSMFAFGSGGFGGAGLGLGNPTRSPTSRPTSSSPRSVRSWG